MKKHFAGIFRSQSNEHPWERMIACGLATGCPLLIGVLTNRPAFSVYGALTGYLLTLNDHFGRFRHRLFVVTATLAMLFVFFALGTTLHSESFAFTLIFVGAVYGLGLFGGRGAELERGLLFATLGLAIAFATPPIPPEARRLLGLFAALGYVSLLLTMTALRALRGSPPLANTTFGKSAGEVFTLDPARHAHALSYALSALASIWIGRLMDVERGYWITITVLLIMRPDRSQSLQMTAQRLIGTLLAVMLVYPFLGPAGSVPAFALLATASGAAVPWGARRNYVWVSFFATVLVVCLLEIADKTHGDTHLPLVRLQATFLGCAVSLLGTGVSKILDVVLTKAERRRRRFLRSDSTSATTPRTPPDR